MIGDTYKVIKDIPDGWDCGAQIGDTLKEKIYGDGSCRMSALFKGKSAVCDPDSKYGKECCIKIKDQFNVQ